MIYLALQLYNHWLNQTYEHIKDSQWKNVHPMERTMLVNLNGISKICESDLIPTKMME